MGSRLKPPGRFFDRPLFSLWAVTLVKTQISKIFEDVSSVQLDNLQNFVLSDTWQELLGDAEAGFLTSGYTVI